MQASTLRMAGASLALAALVTGCSNPVTNETSVPSTLAPRNYVVTPATNGTAWACKFTVDPITGEVVEGFSSGAITAALVSGAGAVTAGPQTISWPSGTQCVKVWEGTAAAQITVTETPSTGYALSYYKIATPTDQNPFNRIYVNADNSPSPTGATVNLSVDGSGQWEVWFKNVPFTPPPPSGGNEGCTPGYWKQSQHFDSWAFYTTSQSFNTVFGGTYFTPDITLLQALGRNGGGINALARHSVAALLNATNGTVDYPDEDTASIIADFQAAVAGGASTIEAQKNTFDRWNNGAGGCPLN
jgi:hypothetical protein